MIKRNRISKEQTLVTITADEIAKELIRQDKQFGAASGSIERLAVDVAGRRFPALIKSGQYIRITVVLPEGTPSASYGLPNNSEVVRHWILATSPEVKGYKFSFSSGYADLPSTIGLQRPFSPLSKRESRRLARSNIRITPKTPRLCR